MRKRIIFVFILFLFSLPLYSQKAPDLIAVFNPRFGSIEEGLESLSVTSEKLSKNIKAPGYELKSVLSVLPEEKDIPDFVEFVKTDSGLEFGNIVFTVEDKALLTRSSYLVAPVIYSAQKMIEQKETGSVLLGWKGRIGWVCVRMSDGSISSRDTTLEFPVVQGQTLQQSTASDIEGLLKGDFFKLKIDFRAQLVRLPDNSLSGVQSYPGQFNPGEELTAYKRTENGPQACGTFIVKNVSLERILLEQIYFDAQKVIDDVYLVRSDSLPFFIMPQGGVYFPDSLAASAGIKLVYEPMLLVFNGYVSGSAMYHILNPVSGNLSLTLSAGIGKLFNFGPAGAFVYLGSGGAITAAGNPMLVVEFGLDAFYRFPDGNGFSLSFSMINLLSDLTNSRSGFLVSGGGFLNL